MSTRRLLTASALVVASAILFRTLRQLGRRERREENGARRLGPRHHDSLDHWPPVPRAPTNGGRPTGARAGE